MRLWAPFLLYLLKILMFPRLGVGSREQAGGRENAVRCLGLVPTVLGECLLAHRPGSSLSTRGGGQVPFALLVSSRFQVQKA